MSLVGSEGGLGFVFSGGVEEGSYHGGGVVEGVGVGGFGGAAASYFLGGGWDVRHNGRIANLGHL